MSRRFDAVLCDNDGCLTPEDASPFDAETLARIAGRNRRAVNLGEAPVLTICSGRPIPFVEAMCRLLGNDALPAIGENGAWLFDPRTNAMELDPRIDAAALGAVCECERWVERELGPEGVCIQPGKHASVSLWHPDPVRLRETIRPRVEARRDAERWPIRVSMTWFYINCDLEFISKGTAIDRLIARERLDTTRLAGIGDTASDIAIAERVAWFGCPANAAPEARARAHAVAELPEARGVLQLLDRLDAW